MYTKISTLVLLLALALTACQAAQPAPQAASPSQVAEQFFNWYFTRTADGWPQDYHESGLLSPVLVKQWDADQASGDPSRVNARACGQDFPASVVADKVVESSTGVSVILVDQWQGPNGFTPGGRRQVSLEQMDGDWKITGMQCLPLE